MYDWANSAFSLTIVSAILPEYYMAITHQEATATQPASDMVEFLGMQVTNSVLFSYTLSASFLLLIILGPILTAWSDVIGRKKIFMQALCYLGVAGCGLLYFFTPGRIPIGTLGLMAGLIGFSGSILFYNSFLPDIVTEDRLDKVSAQGFSLGYVGSVLLLVFNLAVILLPDVFGMDSGEASRFAFLTVGIWWLGWSQWAFSVLPSHSHNPSPVLKATSSWWSAGFGELQTIGKTAFARKGLSRYLPAFLFFNMGVQTVMYVAPLFAKKELHIASSGLIATILLLQIIAIPGALLTSKLSEKWGNKTTLLILVTAWCGITLAAYLTQTAEQFYGLAACVGLVMGGTQSLSRSTYAKLIPEASTDTASYFSFYDVTEKTSIVLGTLAYGLIEQMTGSMRGSVLALLVFFAIGLVMVSRLPAIKGIYREQAAS